MDTSGGDVFGGEQEAGDGDGRSDGSQGAAHPEQLLQCPEAVFSVHVLFAPGASSSVSVQPVSS